MKPDPLNNSSAETVLLLCPRFLKLCRCCGKACENGSWRVYWVAVASGKRLGAGVEGRRSVERTRGYAVDELEGFG